MIKVLGVDNILHAVGDLEQAMEFYGNRLGLTLKFEVPAAGVALYHLGNEAPGLLIRVGQPVPPRMWLEVPDAVAAAKTLNRDARQISTGWVVEIDDPWGNVIGLTDYSRRPDLARHP